MCQNDEIKLDSYDFGKFKQELDKSFGADTETIMRKPEEHKKELLNFIYDFSIENV